MATVNLGAIKFNWQGAYNNSTSYVADDVVSSGGNSYVCILASTGNAVSNGTYWSLMAQAGTNGTNGTDVGTTITTQGDILYRDGSGLQRLAKGTAAQTLAMNSGANAPEWVDPAGGGTKLLETFSNSATPNMEFVAFNHTLYDSYEIFFTSQHSTSNAALWMEVSTDGGSSWSNSNVYDMAAARAESGGGCNSLYQNNTTSITFSGDITNAANERVAGHIAIISPGDGYMTCGTFQFTAQVYNNKFEYRGGGWRYGSATAVNGFRVRTQSGTNNAAYVGRMYGRVK